MTRDEIFKNMLPVFRNSPNVNGYFLLMVCWLVFFVRPGLSDSSTEGCFCEVSPNSVGVPLSDWFPLWSLQLLLWLGLHVNNLIHARPKTSVVAPLQRCGS